MNTSRYHRNKEYIIGAYNTLDEEWRTTRQISPDDLDSLIDNLYHLQATVGDRSSNPKEEHESLKRLIQTFVDLRL